MEAIVGFQWQAAIGDERLTARDLAALEAAATAKQHLVQVRGRWVEVRPDELQAVLCLVGQRGQASVAELLRAGMGLDDLGAPDGAEVVGVEATGWLGRPARRSAPRPGGSDPHSARVRRPAPALPGAGRGLAVLPRPAGARCLSRRRHGARQDGAAAGDGPRRTGRGADTGRVPGVCPGQLAARSGPLHARVAGDGSPRPGPVQRP